MNQIDQEPVGKGAQDMLFAGVSPTDAGQGKDRNVTEPTGACSLRRAQGF